ncbi:MAG: hypothetical protein VXY77_02890 [Pseudomonadota bacterium]|nr:hypothetical protein [Pseudomonadota bacterium]
MNLKKRLFSLTQLTLAVVMVMAFNLHSFARAQVNRSQHKQASEVGCFSSSSNPNSRYSLGQTNQVLKQIKSQAGNLKIKWLHVIKNKDEKPASTYTSKARYKVRKFQG